MAGGNSQAGLFEGESPMIWNSSNPIVLYLIQVIVIIILSNIIHVGLSRIYQPRVVSEIIAGVILGPSVLGNIPKFTSTFFPKESIPSFNTASTVGLIFLMFLVGLEVDLAQVAHHWKPASAVALGGILLPFGLGCAIAIGLWHEFEPQGSTGQLGQDFGVFMMFVGLAMGITAFPVLARIMVELRLLQNPVGVIVLSAGVVNDIIGWALLALAVALARAESHLIAVWVILSGLGFVLFMVYAIRPLLHYIINRIDGVDQEPRESVIVIIVTVLLVSSWFTAIIGLHPIFGAFLGGAILPKQGVLVDTIAERVRLIVNTVLLPAFFALSGINTDIGKLRSGRAWGFTLAVIICAFVGKIVGGALTARICRIPWRESITIGILMSCKGIVELIALNIGLQAKIISERTFTIFVIMALVVTASTKPLALWLYPEHLRKGLPSEEYSTNATEERTDVLECPETDKV